MRALIEDLLLYSRTNTTERKFSITDLNSLLQDVRNEIRERIEEKNATLECSTLPQLSVIPFQFHQLMANLLNNALKFSKKDIAPRILIKADIVTGNQIQSARKDLRKSYHHISISDNGIGFEPEYSTRIFEVFQRLHGRNEYEGTGVGLAICKKIVEIHGGIITAEGKVNEGATFHIYLPADTEN
jgi:light-regulated signal transduction histidine kinase (bacteriophytochrome)